jgi:hypothetical protein
MSYSKYSSSWVKPEDFANMKFVNDYHKSLNLSDKRVTWSSKAIGINYFISILIFMIFFPLINANSTDINLEKGFDFCEFKSNLPPINVDRICDNKLDLRINSSKVLYWLKSNYQEKIFTPKNNGSYKNSLNGIFHFQAYLLSKSINQVSGKAYQCKKIIYTRSWSEGVWGKRFKNDEVSKEVWIKILVGTWYIINYLTKIPSSVMKIIIVDMRIFPLISFLGLQIVQKLFHIVMFHLELLRKVRKTVIFK